MKDMFEKIAELKNLYSAWYKIKNMARDEYIYTGYNVSLYEDNIDEIIRIINYELINDKFVFDKLHSFEVPKKDGKRVFHIDTIKNMIVSQAIINIIGPIIESKFISGSYGYRLELGESCSIYKDWTHQYSDFSNTLYEWNKKYGNKKYLILRYDIKSFFDNVNLDILSTNISQLIKNHRTINLIKKYLYIDIFNIDSARTIGIPQGIYSSGFYANIYLNEFDKQISSKVIGYVRYVDDLFIIIEKNKKDEMNSLIYKQLQSIGLEPNFNKYDEVDVSNYMELVNILNKIKYQSISYLEMQLEALTSKERQELFKSIEDKLTGKENADLSVKDLEDYSEHINYLLFLNNKLNSSNPSLLYLALEVLKNEALKYSKLEKIYKNLFNNDLANEFIINKIDEYPEYIKLSLAKFLLANDGYFYSNEFVNKYLKSDKYLLKNVGLLLSVKLGNAINITECISIDEHKEETEFILSYLIPALIYESQDSLDENVIEELFHLNKNMILFYSYKFNKEDFILEILNRNNWSEVNNYGVIALLKLFFATNSADIYNFIIEKFNNNFILELIKGEIILNKHTVEEDNKQNLQKLVDIYNKIQVRSDYFSQRFQSELRFHIKDGQIVSNVQYIDLGKFEYEFIEQIRYEQKIIDVFIGLNDIQYIFVQYKDTKYILEKADKGIFIDKADYERYIWYLNSLKENELIPNYIIKNFDNYNYIYTLYEISDYNDLLVNRIKNGEKLSIEKLHLVLQQSHKYKKVISQPPLLLPHNILIEGDKTKFLGVLNQVKGSFYRSSSGDIRKISSNRCIESFGYLLLDSYNGQDFQKNIKKGDYENQFDIPHIGSVVNKAISTSKDYSYKSIDNLELDINYIKNFSDFISTIKDKEKKLSELIAIDYVGFKMLQYKRYLKSIRCNYEKLVESYEEVILNFIRYLKDKNLYLKRYTFNILYYKLILRRHKINAYSMSICIFTINYYMNSKEYMNKYENIYKFEGVKEFLNFGLINLCFLFEKETRRKFKCEIAASIDGVITDFKASHKLISEDLESNEEKIIINNSEGLHNDINILQDIKSTLIEFKVDKIKDRKYGKLLISGMFLSENNKSFTVKSGVRYKSASLDIIDKPNQLYIRYAHNPNMSAEFSNGNISNINIESSAVKKFLKRRKGYGELIDKAKEIIIALGIVIFWIAIFTITGVIIQSKIVGILGSIIFSLLSIFYKDLIKAAISKLNDALGIKTK
ncbi:reverse transcriptase domain-containing protein [Clostridium aciditolerans]|uniref:Reverse transcriptase domain-containing protein n=1 Tax=Clostridium aciditolerans TaxID=339861 RepID=A0A934M6R7_9CLOT|nr:reverse transcriptase domain-containing protein [Clostridium aciditolerans]MBI6874888.1 hypothetical protein [Clostridium aciditolerans]